MEVLQEVDMGRYAETRKFGGKTYHLHNIYSRKREAKEIAEGLRGRGFRARVVYIPHQGWAVFKRSPGPR